MATSLRESALFGEWERNGNPGFVAAEIRQNEIIWPDGARHEYSLRGNRVHLTYDGVPFTGTFEGRRLRWSDGDVWIRKAGWEKSQRRQANDTLDVKLANIWKILDKNQDGKLSMQEFMSRYPEASLQLFADSDIDKNRYLDIFEFRRMVLKSETNVDILADLIRTANNCNPTKQAAVSTAIPKARDDELKWGKFGESDPTVVLLRTRKYLQTKQQKHKATRSDSAIATFMGAEIFRGSTQAPTHICDLTESRFGYYVQRDTSDRFYVIINNRVTSKKISVCAFWYFSGSAFHNNPSFEKLWWQFVYGNDDFRNSRFKCYPKIVKGSWALKMMVPNVPTLLGQKVPITYKRGKNFIEIDVECDNNMLASSITKVAYPIAKSLTVDQSYILQAEEEFDLPEIVFAGVRYEGVDLSKALDVNN